MRKGLVVLCCLGALLSTATLGQTRPIAAPAQAPDRSLSDWLLRMHEASRKRAYVGTFVVSSGSSMSSARIWHVCDGDQQSELVTGGEVTFSKQPLDFVQEGKLELWVHRLLQ